MKFEDDSLNTSFSIERRRLTTKMGIREPPDFPSGLTMDSSRLHIYTHIYTTVVHLKRGFPFVNPSAGRIGKRSRWRATRFSALAPPMWSHHRHASDIQRTQETWTSALAVLPTDAKIFFGSWTRLNSVLLNLCPGLCLLAWPFLPLAYVVTLEYTRNIGV